MFTGIVTDVGTILSTQQRGDLRVRIGTGFDLATVDLGASIACSGICLTVVDKGEDWFEVDVSAETRSRTAPGLWTDGTRVNLERSLRMGDELGGHIVTGHVDGLGEVIGTCAEGGSTRIGIRVAGELGKAIAAKGSVTLDGVSLTVNTAVDDVFSVLIIPHTLQVTTLRDWRAGSEVNLEIDLMARYAARLTEMRT